MQENLSFYFDKNSEIKVIPLFYTGKTKTLLKQCMFSVGISSKIRIIFGRIEHILERNDQNLDLKSKSKFIVQLSFGSELEVKNREMYLMNGF